MKISVVMMAYNHERFISQAIESVLSQKTDFDIELLIGEDCSTDSTRDIVQRYGNKFSNIIRLYLPAKNVGSMKNFLALLENASGDYIAFLEGDDFWINPYKLQIQATYLDEHPECAGCFGDSFIVDENSRATHFTYYSNRPPPKQSYSFDDIINIIGITPANTIIFRRSILARMPEWFKRLPGHSALELFICQHGSLDFLNYHFGARRVQDKSIWASKPLLFQLQWTLVYKKLLLEDFHIKQRYDDIICSQLMSEVSRILQEISTKGVDDVPDVLKATNVNLMEIALSPAGTLPDAHVERASSILSEAADKLLDCNNVSSAYWLYQVALYLAPHNASARFGRIYSGKMLTCLAEV